MNYNKDLKDNDILDLIESDDIGRNIYLTKLLNVLDENGYNRIFSLNGKWGSGKTIFIKKFILLVNYCSIYNEGTARECKYDIFKGNDAILSRLKIISEKQKFKEFKKTSNEKLINAAYFNAWEHDDEDDPIMSIVYCLIKQFNLCENTDYINKVTNLFGLISTFTRGKIDVPVEIEKTDVLKEIKIKDKLKELVTDTLSSLIEENCEKLILFIDEVDRCNPLYAIKLLERIKHYFNHDRLVIVITTNLSELSSTISSVYGEKFSSYKYLDKFFDMKLELPLINNSKFVGTFDLDLNKDKSTFLSIVVDEAIKYNNLEMREISRYLEIMRYFEKRIFSGKTNGFYESYKLNDYLFIPYFASLYIAEIEKYNNFINGTGGKELIDFVSGNDQIMRLCKYVFYPNKSRTPTEITAETIIEDLEEFYNYVYGNDKDKKQNIGMKEIGEMEITGRDVEQLRKSISLLSDISYFQ